MKISKKKKFKFYEQSNFNHFELRGQSRNKMAGRK